MTIGSAATTRLSTAAVVQVAQPRLLAPLITNFSILGTPEKVDKKSVTVSLTTSKHVTYKIFYMARTAAFVIGRRASQLGSSKKLGKPGLRKFTCIVDKFRPCERNQIIFRKRLSFPSKSDRFVRNLIQYRKDRVITTT